MSRAGGTLRRAGALGALLALSALATAARGDPPARGVRYVVSTDSAIERMSVRVCFEGRPPARLGPGVSAAASALIDATDDAGRALPVRDARIELRGVSPGACIRYRLDLDAARRASRFAGRYGHDIVSSQGVWLWRDRSRVPRRARIRFALPEGVYAHTPWPANEHGWQRLDAAAFRRAGFVAFSHRAATPLRRRGARVRLARLGDEWTTDDATLRRWLETAIDGVSSVQGRFPVDDLLVIVVPSRGSGMGFGMVRRGGGYAVSFVLGRESSLESLTRSWVTWHELSHLQLPALPQEDAWLYEGIATYYQEVLPARLGIQTSREAWAAIVAGLDRGANSRRTRAPLSVQARTMMRTGAYQRVYWSGTAFALEADVALRRRGGSLDRAIRGGARSWRRSMRVRSSMELCSAWDRPFATGLLQPLRDRYARTATFPRTGRLLGRLGVARGPNDEVTLRPAELSALRDAIMER